MKLKHMMSMRIFAKIKASSILADIPKIQSFMTTKTTTKQKSNQQNAR